MGRIERVREVFDDWARRGRAEGMERGHAHAARLAFERLDVRPGSRYLDIGCGNGYTVRWAAELSPDVAALGVDVSPAMIERARAASAHLPNARFVCGPFPGVDLPAGSFDAVLSMEVFYYLDDLDAGLAEVARLLAPSGRFACVVDYYEENAASHGWPEEMGLPLHRLSERGWANAFRRAGLDVVEQARLRAPGPAPGEERSWKHTHGSLLTLGRRPPS